MTTDVIRRLRNKGYDGPLTLEQAAAGIAAAAQNARALLEDAELLLKNHRWPRAASLAMLSIEEGGKLPILRELLLVESKKDLEAVWRRYRSHTAKNALSGIPSLAKDSHLPRFDDCVKIFRKDAEHPLMYDKLKQIGFYSDCFRQGLWSVPTNVVGQETAESLISLARILVPTGKDAFQSVEELRLWVKHMKPVWRRDYASMKAALVACYREASHLGVLQGDQSAEEIIRWILESPTRNPGA